jgi:hypothetical protein
MCHTLQNICRSDELNATRGVFCAIVVSCSETNLEIVKIIICEMRSVIVVIMFIVIIIKHIHSNNVKALQKFAPKMRQRKIGGTRTVALPESQRNYYYSTDY